LHDVVTQRSARAVQDVPVAQDVRRAVRPVVDDGADGAGADVDVPHAHARNDRVDPNLAIHGDRLGHHPERRLVPPLQHVRRHGHAVDRDGLR
jgi:hypothetical protein